MTNKKSNTLKYLIFGVILIVGITLDQVTKHLLDNKELFHDGLTVINNFFYIRIAYNTGVSWGMFAGNFIILYIVPIVALLAFIYLLYRGKFENMKFYIIGISLMTAGTIGNYIDRVTLKHVIDFLEFHFGSYRYPTFNVADMMLVIGVILFSIDILFLDYRRLKKEETEVVEKDE